MNHQNEIKSGQIIYQLSDDKFADACRADLIDPAEATITGARVSDDREVIIEVEGPECAHLIVECLTCKTSKPFAPSTLRERQVPGYELNYYCPTCKKNGGKWLTTHSVIDRIEPENDRDADEEGER